MGDQTSGPMELDRVLTPTRTTATTYTPHTPIAITSDADFAAQGWPGNGTADNPYLIEGLNITSAEDGICISYVTVYFEIRNCFISSKTLWYYKSGVALYNVTHGIIRDSVIQEHYYGISVSKSPGTVLINNTVLHNNAVGFYLYDSSSCILTNNTSSYNGRYGFYLYSSSSCMLINNTASDNDHGFDLLSSDACILTNNTATYNKMTGFYLNYSGSCTLTKNKLLDNGVIIYSLAVNEWLHDMSDNIVNGRPLGYFAGLTSGVIDGSQYGQVILANCSDVTVKNGVFNNASIGIELGYSVNCALTNNTTSYNYWFGFYLHFSNACTLINNTSYNSFDGVYLYSSSSCTLINNTASYNRWSGFCLHYSNSCIMTDNTASYNLVVGFVVASDFCRLVHNTATHNRERGISISSGSSNNVIYGNVIGYNNVSNARDDGTDNSWDDGVSMGNYWSDYGGLGPYHIPGSAESVDRYPRRWPPTDMTLSTIILLLGLVVAVAAVIIILVVIVLAPKGGKTESQTGAGPEVVIIQSD